MNQVIINVHNDAYSTDRVHSMCVEDLISILSGYDPNAKVILSFDGGYTYGGVQEEDIEEVEA